MNEKLSIVRKTSEIDPRRQPPDSELLKQIKDRFSNNADKSTKLLLRSPESIMEPMNRVKNYLQKFPFAPNKALWHFINYLVQYGALIMTDDPTRRYFFDTEQLDELIRAGQRREVPVVKYEPESRLAAFLSGSHQAPLRSLSAEEIKALFVSDMFDLLKNICEEHPEAEALIHALGHTVAGGCAANPTKAQSLSANLALTLEETLRKIVTRVENQALELVTMTEPRLEPQKEVAKEKVPDVIGRLTTLSAQVNDWQSQLDRLRREQNCVEHYLSDVKQRVLEEELKPRLNFAEADDLKKVELAIERAHAKTDELNEHIEKLLTLQAPIENRIRELQRWQSALKICVASQEKELTAVPAIALPPRPTYDADELLNWQAIDLTEEMATTIVTDLSAFTAEERLLIAAFQVIERKTSTGKMAHALVALGLSGGRSEKELRHTCRQLSEREPPVIRYVGSVAQCAIYRHAGSVVIGNVNAIIPENKQTELLAMFHKPTTEAG